MNYTVLVVDDEEEQRRALIQRVDWASAGFEVIGEAENGVEALDLVETLAPDLILTDIRMPMISGLEMAARVRELRPATQIVILSGYDSFEYARTAIDYNIISYLLKPISSAEMSEELFEIHRRMDEKIGSVLSVHDRNLTERLQRLSVNEFLLPLLLGTGERYRDEEKLKNEAVALGILPAGDRPYRLCVLISKFKNQDEVYVTAAEHTDFINNVLTRYHHHAESLIVYQRVVSFVVFSGEGDFSNILELPLREIVQTAERRFSLRCTIGVSREFSRLADCSDAYFQAVTARRYTSDGTGDVRFIGDQEPNEAFEAEHAEKTALELEQLLKVGGREELSAFINSFFEKSTPENANLLVFQIIATVCRVLGSVSEQGETVQLLSDNPLFSRLTSHSSEAGMRKEILDFCERAKDLILTSQKRETENLCDRVVRIIEEQYADETLSLTGVSNTLAVSPNYLSALIKKTKKKNFITLLTERRMRAAYDMLVCTGMKVLEVAEKCGYSDQHYFSYCFKKFYGESPNKVRSTSRAGTEKTP